LDKELLLRHKEQGVARKLVGFELLDRGIPRHGYVVCDQSGTEIGVVTSGTMGPAVKKALGWHYAT
jgi:aminomethyltransferase